MANGYTVFFSYLLKSNNGYSNAIHCNYINSTVIETLTNKEININFDNVDDFKFLSTTEGTGYTANKIYMLVQLINNSIYVNESDIKPDSAKWKIYDVTDQTYEYVTGNSWTLTPDNITNSVYKVPVYLHNTMEDYNLDYLDYPNINSDNDLCFGDEQYFLGNVSSDVEAIAYTTDLAISMPLNQFNTSENNTWNNSALGVYVTEVGIYDSDKNLVAIGKLNNPLRKDSTISRTIVFAIDF